MVLITVANFASIKTVVNFCVTLFDESLKLWDFGGVGMTVGVNVAPILAFFSLLLWVALISIYYVCQNITQETSIAIFSICSKCVSDFIYLYSNYKVRVEACIVKGNGH